MAATSDSVTASMCRPFARLTRAELLHRGREHVAALRVVAKHVEAGARRRQQHRVAGLRESRRGTHRLLHVSTRAVWQMPASAVSMSPASRPNNTVVRTLPRNAAASGVKSWPLPSPPAITTSGPASPLTAASVAPTLVPLESLM